MPQSTWISRNTSSLFYERKKLTPIQPLIIKSLTKSFFNVPSSLKSPTFTPLCLASHVTNLE